MADAAMDDGYLPNRGGNLRWVLTFLAASLMAHAAAFAWLSRYAASQPRSMREKPLELVMFEVEQPKPSPPEPEPAKPLPPSPKPPIKVAAVKTPKPPPPDPTPPPPPNQPAPEPVPQPPPLVVGVQMSSTTTAGSFSAPVGNTSYGKVDSTARAPNEVKPYTAPKYMPIYQVDREPTVAEEPTVEYPPEAKRAGIEGDVLLEITVTVEGRVENARVVRGAGYGLDEAALKAIGRFKFRPATKNGEAVSTTLKYTYRFYLE